MPRPRPLIEDTSALGRGLGDHPPECVGGGDAVVDLDPEWWALLDGDRHVGIGVADGVGDKLARQQLSHFSDVAKIGGGLSDEAPGPGNAAGLGGKRERGHISKSHVRSGRTR